MILSFWSPAGAELRSAGQPNHPSSRKARGLGTPARAAVPTRLTIVLAILAPLAISSNLHALPVPKAPSPDLHSVRMVQQSIPLPDGVHLSATLYMPGDAKPGEKYPALLEYLPY